MSFGNSYIPNTDKSFQGLATDLYGHETNLQTRIKHGNPCTETARYCYETERDREREREREGEGKEGREKEKQRKKEKTLLRKGYFVSLNWGKETEVTLCLDLLG